METIEATFRVVTPMFCSGADQTKAELRLPSIKGALRFWWRALAWGRLNGDLTAIRDEEAKLFGSTDTGQAAVLMRLGTERKPPDTLETDEILTDNGRVVGEAARYLGYGVMEAFASSKKGTQAGQLTRACLQAPFEFDLKLSFKCGLSKRARASMLDAVKLLGLVSGLGSKSRKGYGSLTLVNLNYRDNAWSAPDSIDALAVALKDFRSIAPFSRHTALSKDSRLLIIEGNRDDTPLSLLDHLGREMVFYRSWGKNGKVLHKSREGNFEADHDLMKRLKTSIKYPERVVFGLPQNYGKSKDLQVIPVNYDRRASPLFLHIHQISKMDGPVAVISFLPSLFLPKGEPLKLLNTQVQPSYGTTFWQPINDFLERMKGIHDARPLKRHEQFSRVVEV